jgi:hypothetical protein
VSAGWGPWRGAPAVTGHQHTSLTAILMRAALPRCIDPYMPEHNSQLLLYAAANSGELAEAERYADKAVTFPSIFGPQNMADGERCLSGLVLDGQGRRLCTEMPPTPRTACTATQLHSSSLLCGWLPCVDTQGVSAHPSPCYRCGLAGLTSPTSALSSHDLQPSREGIPTTSPLAMMVCAALHAGSLRKVGPAPATAAERPGLLQGRCGDAAARS